MEQDQAIKVFESLASGLRLDVYRLLMRAGPEGLVAGDIASALNVPPTNLSFHLKALTQSGLLGVTPEGRYQRYRAQIPTHSFAFIGTEKAKAAPGVADAIAGAIRAKLQLLAIIPASVL